MRQIIAVLAVAVSCAAIAPAHADVIKTGSMFVADYGLSQLDRYQYTYNQTTNAITAITPYGFNGNTSNAYFLGGSSLPVKEGIHGTANDIILVGGTHGSGVTTISRYTLDGAYIGTIPINFSAYNSGNVGIGNVLVTPDGKYMYAPLETAGYVVKVSLADGSIISSYKYAGAHDVAQAADGTVYVANYNASGAAIIALNSNLDASSLKTVVSASNSGVSGSFRPTGLSIASDGTLYVDNNVRGGPDSVLHYNVGKQSDGTYVPSLLTGSSYIGSSSKNGLEFTFGNSIGPDGNLYIAALGGGGNGSFSVTSGYTDGIYMFSTLTDTLTRVIDGTKEPSGGVGATGLSAPKYLQFDSNFVSAPDAGYSVVEPASAMLLLGAVGGFGALRRRRRWG